MKRVLLVSNYAWTVFNFRRRLIVELRERGYEVFVQTQFDGYEGRLGLPREYVLPLSINRKGLNPLEDLMTIVSVLKALKATRADTCLLFTIKPVIYGGMACTLARTPYLPNITGLGTAFLGAAWLRFIAKALYRVGLSSAAKVFFQNKTDLDLFVTARLVEPKTAVLVPGSGVDLDRYRATPFPANRQTTFLFMGRLLADKGVNEFVEAARSIKRKREDVRFQLLGAADAVNRTSIRREQINQWMDEGVIEYLGETDDVRPCIAASDCVVLPSYREGTPRALLEAAAMARPIVTTDATGCRDVVDHGVTGLMCRTKDAADLADKMTEMANYSHARRQQMGMAGRAKIQREYDEKIVLERYAAELRLLGG